ncbi:MAG: hypothetical protein ACTHNU_02985 [Gaiellales bacterium]
MKRVLQYGGIVSGVVLVAFGIAAIWMGASGLSTVNSSLKDEHIVGTPDMTPAAIAVEAKQAHVPASIKLPTCSVANETVNSGDRARCFAEYMRIHTMEATGGLTYSQMPRYATADGKGTNDVAKALKVNGAPQDNQARNIWVTETALTTALNSSFMAQQLSYFGIVVGVALLLSGAGFVILALGGPLGHLKLQLRRDESAEEPVTKGPSGTAIPTA